MCTCASCKATDALSGYKWDKAGKRRVPTPSGGFENWPKGDPVGPRGSAALYAQHVAHGRSGIAQGWEYRPGVAPTFPAWCRGAPPLPRPSKLVADFIAAGYKAAPSCPEAAAPTSPARPADTSPERDRPPEAATIYPMPKKPAQRVRRGRPSIPGRRVIIKLEEWQIQRAKVLGGGGKQAIAAGIRKLFGQSSV